MEGWAKWNILPPSIRNSCPEHNSVQWWTTKTSFVILIIFILVESEMCSYRYIFCMYSTGVDGIKSYCYCVLPKLSEVFCALWLLFHNWTLCSSIFVSSPDRFVLILNCKKQESLPNHFCEVTLWYTRWWMGRHVIKRDECFLIEHTCTVKERHIFIFTSNQWPRHCTCTLWPELY